MGLRWLAYPAASACTRCTSTVERGFQRELGALRPSPARNSRRVDTALAGEEDQALVAAAVAASERERVGARAPREGGLASPPPTEDVCRNGRSGVADPGAPVDIGTPGMSGPTGWGNRPTVSPWGHGHWGICPLEDRRVCWPSASKALCGKALRLSFLLGTAVAQVPRRESLLSLLTRQHNCP